MDSFLKTKTVPDSSPDYSPTTPTHTACYLKTTVVNGRCIATVAHCNKLKPKYWGEQAQPLGALSSHP